MFRFIQILAFSFLFASCKQNQSHSLRAKQDYPESADFNSLPKNIHVVGTIKEVSYGFCGVLCLGGYIKVDLKENIPNYNCKSVYLITACLSSEIKTYDTVDVTASLHTGREEECYFKNFNRPGGADKIVVYNLNEGQTKNIH